MKKESELQLEKTYNEFINEFTSFSKTPFNGPIESAVMILKLFKFFKDAYDLGYADGMNAGYADGIETKVKNKIKSKEAK